MTFEFRASVGGVDVSRETFAALRSFEGLVRKWSPAINLVSRASLAGLWDRHVVDSAQLFGMMQDGARHWADLGSGGGFPGIVVALLARQLKPDLRFTLVESDRRKAAFLQQASQLLGLDVTILAERIESVPPLGADVLSARALAPLSDLLTYAALHLGADGVALFPKGSRHEQEIADAQAIWKFDAQTQPSLSDPDAAILMIRNIHRARQD